MINASCQPDVQEGWLSCLGLGIDDAGGGGEDDDDGTASSTTLQWKVAGC